MWSGWDGDGTGEQARVHLYQEAVCKVSTSFTFVVFAANLILPLFCFCFHLKKTHFVCFLEPHMSHWFFAMNFKLCNWRLPKITWRRAIFQTPWMLLWLDPWWHCCVYGTRSRPSSQSILVTGVEHLTDLITAGLPFFFFFFVFFFFFWKGGGRGYDVTRDYFQIAITSPA